jgi:hypothetical protein
MIAGAYNEQKHKEWRSLIIPEQMTIFEKNPERIKRLEEEKDGYVKLIQYLDEQFIEGKIDEEVYKSLKSQLKERLDAFEDRLKKAKEFEEKKEEGYNRLLRIHNDLIVGKIPEEEYGLSANGYCLTSKP